jgi:hypothetical protein
MYRHPTSSNIIGFALNKKKGNTCDDKIHHPFKDILNDTFKLVQAAKAEDNRMYGCKEACESCS